MSAATQWYRVTLRLSYRGVPLITELRISASSWKEAQTTALKLTATLSPMLIGIKSGTGARLVASTGPEAKGGESNDPEPVEVVR